MQAVRLPDSPTCSEVKELDITKKSMFFDTTASSSASPCLSLRTITVTLNILNYYSIPHSISAYQRDGRNYFRTQIIVSSKKIHYNCGKMHSYGVVQGHLFVGFHRNKTEEVYNLPNRLEFTHYRISRSFRRLHPLYSLFYKKSRVCPEGRLQPD